MNTPRRPNRRLIAMVAVVFALPMMHLVHAPDELPRVTSRPIVHVCTGPVRWNPARPGQCDCAGRASLPSSDPDLPPLADEEGVPRSGEGQSVIAPPSELSLPNRPAPIAPRSPCQQRVRQKASHPTAVQCAFASRPAVAAFAAEVLPTATLSRLRSAARGASARPSAPGSPGRSGRRARQPDRVLSRVPSMRLQGGRRRARDRGAQRPERRDAVWRDRQRVLLAAAEGPMTDGDSADGDSPLPEPLLGPLPTIPPEPAEAPEKFGEAPEETNTELQFLRRDSVLLDPGQYQIDVTCEYLVDESDSVLAEIDDGVVRIGEIRRRQRLLLVPLEFRLGICENAQVFVNVPFGWSNSELAFLGIDEYANAGGIGDVSAGLTKVLLERDEFFPDVLGTLAFSAPTGRASVVSSLSTPGSSLGEGFWSLTMDLTFIHTYDPVVVFYGFGYRHRFSNEFEGGVRVEAGNQASYRVGLGLAVNPRVTLSASFLGAYIGDDRVNDVRIGGSIREPMYLRLAATIVRDTGPCQTGGSPRTVEPFFRTGMTDEAVDALIGVSWTR
jgi:hypothetical protein